jgi:hypothetical protein
MLSNVDSSRIDVLEIENEAVLDSFISSAFEVKHR